MATIGFEFPNLVSLMQGALKHQPINGIARPNGTAKCMSKHRNRILSLLTGCKCRVTTRVVPLRTAHVS